MPSHIARPIKRDTPPEPEAKGLLADIAPEAEAIGEWLRRIALGLTAALIVSRSFWPAEARSEADSGSGLDWSLAMLCTGLIAAIGAWLRGRLRIRASRADFGVFLLMVCVVLSARLAPERRVALNFTWEWVGVGAGYFLLRNLPRSKGEVSALAAVFVATAVALAMYGLYQVVVEYPRDRAFFLAHPREALIQLGIDPAQASHFHDRLVGSREPVATFALTNTLAGVLVGPCAIALVLAIRGLASRTTRWFAVLASSIVLILVVVLMLTKSRSAYLGLLVAMLGLAWQERGRASVKKIALVGFVGFFVVVSLVTVATLTGQLDRQVITESGKSLSYRAEYWRGAWDVIRDGPSRWLTGYGPSNFSGPYLKHKPLGASENVADPHNLFLEVWSSAGIVALIGLVAGLGFGFRECFARPGLVAVEEIDPSDETLPSSSLWLVLAAGIGGPVLAVVVGHVSPFDSDPIGGKLFMGFSARWLILVFSWLLAGFLAGPLWCRSTITAEALGLGAVAIAVNLLAAGGIGFAPVALMLWGMLALGQDLREDRASGARRERLPWGWTIALMVASFLPAILLGATFLLVPVAVVALLVIGGRGPAFVLVGGLTATIGTFFGTVAPFREAEAAIVSAEAAQSGPKPDLEVAAQMYRRATQADPLGSRAWLAWTMLEFENWRRGGGDPMLFTWHKIDSMQKKASERPRNPGSLRVHRMRAGMARAFLNGPDLVPAERSRILIDRATACAAACALHPTDAELRAELAEAMADLDRFQDAVEHGVKAVKLDDAMPHADKKLPPAVRTRLIMEIPRWRAGRR